ncbi:catalase 1 [Entophlyctis helioformis]|nr:catalase 1 [Entophlyctis helioformis]
MSKPQHTTSSGCPVHNPTTSATAGFPGPIVLQDVQLLDKLGHFDRERIPDRVVHAKGAGAHGYFEVIDDVSAITSAKFLNRVGKRTPIFARFSTMLGERGSADTTRDLRGFAVKFYTEEGIWDMSGSNSPVFHIRDPLKYPDLVHTHKKHPQTNVSDPDAHWDFLSLVPESLHQVAFLHSDRGIPNGYCHMNGYAGHTYKFVNGKGDYRFVKFHFKTNQGIQNLGDEQAALIAANDPDYATRDLFKRIARADFPSWTLSVQVMSPEQAASYRWNVFDVTKVWPHKDFPLQPLGRMVLDRNPENFFAEVEQVSFSPANLVPGIDVSWDKVLQGRLFACSDAARYRLGANYMQIPVNAPFTTRVHNHQRDGLMTINSNGGPAPAYHRPTDEFEASVVGSAAVAVANAAIPATAARGRRGSYSNAGGLAREGDEGTVGSLTVGTFPGAKAGSHQAVQRHRVAAGDEDFVQPGEFWRRVLSDEERERLVARMAGSLAKTKRPIWERMISIVRKADAGWADALEQALVVKARA